MKCDQSLDEETSTILLSFFCGLSYVKTSSKSKSLDDISSASKLVLARSSMSDGDKEPS